jgi:hypothetical protein
LADDERPEFELVSGELLFVGETTLPDPVLVVLVGIENVGNVFLAAVPVLEELDIATNVIVEVWLVDVVEAAVGTSTGAMDWTKLLENTGIPLDSTPARLAI